MKQDKNITRRALVAVLFLLAGLKGLSAQEKTDSLLMTDSLQQKVAAAPTGLYVDSIAKGKKTNTPRDWSTWRPDPKRALWLALVIPGGGQIYNRKYWKLPIFYGGFVGCAYALRWNNMMYRDYSQAYLDIMDNDPTTESYNKFLHLGSTITPENADKWKDVFRKRKDRYRRWRDMSVFVMIGIYGLSVVDAYVDASLSQFDISPNLSLRVSPTVITNDTGSSLLALRQSGIGLQCSINF